MVWLCFGVGDRIWASTCTTFLSICSNICKTPTNVLRAAFSKTKCMYYDRSIFSPLKSSLIFNGLFWCGIGPGFKNSQHYWGISITIEELQILKFQ